MKKLLIGAVIGAFMLVASVCWAGIPFLMNYQGMLTDAEGNPLNGDYDLTFKIYSQTSGGSALWTEAQTGVKVQDGLFNVTLGSVSTLQSSVFDDTIRYLGITVGSDPELSPRIRITSMAYAYRALVADSAAVAGSVVGSGGGWVDDGAVVRLQDSTDKVGVGTDNPGVKLHIVGGGDVKVPTPNTGYLITGPSTGHHIAIDDNEIMAKATGDSVGDLYIQWSDEARTLIRGKVGIGTTSPSHKLHVTTSSGNAVYGKNESSSNYGSLGSYDSGVKGYSSSGKGVTGSSSTGTGVYGYNSSGYGVWGISYTGTGVYYSGGLAGSGSKSCIVKTSKGPTLLYCQESPENWFEDFGEAKLSAGRCHLELDPLFLETVTINETNPMKVFIQLNEECNGTYVERGRTGFDVIELQSGQSNARFTYRVVAKRSGFEDKRLNVCEAAKADPYLYPEIKEMMDRE